jgi:hypothetical protein
MFVLLFCCTGNKYCSLKCLEKIYKYKRNSFQKECGEKEYSKKKKIQNRKGKMYTTKEQAHPQKHS